MKFKSIYIVAILLVISACDSIEEDQVAERQFYGTDIHHYNVEEYFDVERAGGMGFVVGELINRKEDGYRGIWYMNTPLDNEYAYKYSGGLGTYTDYHDPFAVYRPEVNKTFFTYGGTDSDNSTVFHMVSYFDHDSGMIPKPTLVLDKNTDDAHDNPVIQVDDDGYIWIFSTSHGEGRPSYVTRSIEPYSIDEFEIVPVTHIVDGEEVPMTNFSYSMNWYLPNQGFISFFTKYNYPAARTLVYKTSQDGEHWSEWQRLAAIKSGHYQISATDGKVAGSAFNFHPDRNDEPLHVSYPVNYDQDEDGNYIYRRPGLDYRTNLYYVETRDFGESWQSVTGETLDMPLTEVENPAKVRDYYSKGLNVYPKDMIYDDNGHPIIVYMTSGGYVSGPDNDPRTWKIARWNGEAWLIHDITTSDNNYDMGSLYVGEDNVWRLIAPTETGPQEYNTGGEMALWESYDQGQNWEMVRQLTSDSERNHSYARRPENVHPDFYAIWADGHGRQPSISLLYFADQEGNVFQLPEKMEHDKEYPIPLE
jgi:hypothetical protein